MMRARRWLSRAALLTTLVGATSPAAAQEVSDRERAKASFKAGANAYAAGDYLAAIQALDAAYELTPLPAIAFSLAQAERKQYAVKSERDHLERAVALFERYLEQEPNGARRADAARALAELRPQLGQSPSHELPKVQARPTRLMIVSDTPGARISLDGGPASGSPLIREVSPGKHRARLEASGYANVERDVTAVQGELLLSEVHLSERPTSLYVWAPEGADIYVDGVYMGTGGSLVTMLLVTGRHQLMVAQPGRRLVRRELRLRRGQTHTEVVTLEPTMQRTLSELLFYGGGASLGVGVVLSAFAVRSENSAENFLARRRHATQYPADLIGYNASLAERDRLRTASVISIAGSFGFFITGLFLHELDRPSLTAAARHEPRGPEASRTGPNFAFSPFVAGEAGVAPLGASFRLNF